MAKETIISASTAAAKAGIAPGASGIPAATAPQVPTDEPVGEFRILGSEDGIALGARDIPVATVSQTPTEAPVGEPRILGGGAAAFRATAEEVSVSRSATGEPRSASIEPRPATIDETFGVPRRARATRTVPDLIATSLPARTRVLSSGLEVPAHPRAADAGEERLFTAKSRIMRSKTLYDIGAPVPLTRAEFVSKRRVDAVSELSFDEGEDCKPFVCSEGTPSS